MAKNAAIKKRNVVHLDSVSSVEKKCSFVRVGDSVVIMCHDEGYRGMTGTVEAVFASGRCLVSVGKIALLNVPPEGLQHAMPTL
jgi:hypothetical protein